MFGRAISTRTFPFFEGHLRSDLKEHPPLGPCQPLAHLLFLVPLCPRPLQQSSCPPTCSACGWAQTSSPATCQVRVGACFLLDLHICLFDGLDGKSLSCEVHQVRQRQRVSASLASKWDRGSPGPGLHSTGRPASLVLEKLPSTPTPPPTHPRHAVRAAQSGRSPPACKRWTCPTRKTQADPPNTLTPHAVRAAQSGPSPPACKSWTCPIRRTWATAAPA